VQSAEDAPPAARRAPGEADPGGTPEPAAPAGGDAERGAADAAPGPDTVADLAAETAGTPESVPDAVGATDPAPEGEVRQPGVAHDAADVDSAPGCVTREAAPGDSGGGGGRWVRWRPSWRTFLLVGPVALGLVGGALLGVGVSMRDGGATGNRALTDTAATEQVTGEISDALGRIFAYTPDGTQTTAQAARDVLDGTAATQYQQLFAQIRQQVSAQRLTLTTRVVRAGVVSLTADRARLLVFLDQTAQRAGGPATSAAAQLAVTARHEGGHWRITDLTAR
jgi:Mce-associated membrane protein